MKVSKKNLFIIALCSLIIFSAFFFVNHLIRAFSRYKTHEEIIENKHHEYIIVQGGTLDGNNCRSPVNYNGWEQSWESNLRVRLENIGESIIVNPWLSNGRNNFRTLEEIIENVTSPEMTDRERVQAIYWDWIRHRTHATTNDPEAIDPVKIYNIYGYTICANDAVNLAILWNACGLNVRPGTPYGHSVSEVFYDNKWHFLDGDLNRFFLLRDNKTIASEKDLVYDHDLIKRVCSTSKMNNYYEYSMVDLERYASLFDGGLNGIPFSERKKNLKQILLNMSTHKMDMTLRPGESIEWRWPTHDPIKYHGRIDLKNVWSNALKQICNGVWEYNINFSNDIWREYVDSCIGIQRYGDSLKSIEKDGGYFIWKLSTPYVIVGGNLKFEGKNIRFAISWDGEKWLESGENLDEFFPRDGPPRYKYYIKCQLGKNSKLTDLTIKNDLQMTQWSLPSMRIGENRFIYSDETRNSRSVKITHCWRERATSLPPQVPEAIFPENNSIVDSTSFTFLWNKPQKTSGSDVSEYHFQLSERADMKWPISPNFDRIIKDVTIFRLIQPGLLNTGTRYYWRIRAKNKDGIWGQWSTIYNFTLSGPEPPVNLRLEYDHRLRTAVLKWDPNTKGTPAVRFKVYGSDEKGFSSHDCQYNTYQGDVMLDNLHVSHDFELHENLSRLYKVSFNKDKFKLFGQIKNLPQNLIAQTNHTNFQVIGPPLTNPNCNKAFYRVVAVDKKGTHSGPSDYVTMEMPYILDIPPVTAEVGKKYSYHIRRVIVSAGNMTQRTVIFRDGSMLTNVANFWYNDIPEISLVNGPSWIGLHKEQQTTILSGIPDKPGKYNIIVRVTVRRENKFESGEQNFLLTVKE